jgi:hypothetical protein
LAERLHELERNTNPGQMLVGVLAIVPLRIDDGMCIRELVIGFVMIGNDQVESELPCPPRCLGAANAAVDGNDDVYAVGVQSLECRRLQAISVPQTFGNEVHHLAAEQLQRAPKDDGGGDAVDVVIAVDRNSFTLRNRLEQSVDGAPHVGQPHRIEQVVE